MKKLLLAVGAALSIAAGIAFAQTPGAGFPGLFITSPVGNEQINVIGGGPQIETVNLRQLRDAAGYAIATPLTGFTITMGSNTSVLSLSPAGTLATGTVNFPQNPVDGQRAQIFTNQTITALTIAAAAGQTINGTAVTTLSANGNVEYIYQLSNTTWYRIQ